MQVGKAKFRKHHYVLATRARIRCTEVELFDTVLSATVLFGLHTVPLTQSQLHDLDALQRCMLRSVICGLTLCESSSKG